MYDSIRTASHTNSLSISLIVKHLGLDAAREEARKVLDMKYEPKGDTSLSDPKYGKEDPQNKPHTGGNTWAGGVRSTPIFIYRENY